jgi:hypothetical protein
MSDQNQTLREDIAFMRSLAEEGRAGSLAGGSILMCAGLIYAVAALVTAYAEANGLITNGVFFPIVWFGATALFLLCLFFLKSGMPAKTGAPRGASLAWTGAGWSIFVIVIALMLMSYRANAWWLMAACAPMILAIYGGCWFVAAAVSKLRWLYGVAFGSFLMAGVTAWYAQQPTSQFLAYAAALLALLALPGYLLTRQAQSA